MVAVVAFARTGAFVRVAAARGRFKAMTAQPSQAALALNFAEGGRARAGALRSAWTFSMSGWRALSRLGKAVSRVLAAGGGEEGLNRQVSNRVSWPSLCFGFSSGMRRTISRPGTWSAFFFDVKAVNGTSAT